MHTAICERCGQEMDLRARHVTDLDCARDWPRSRFAPPIRRVRVGREPAASAPDQTPRVVTFARSADR